MKLDEIKNEMDVNGASVPTFLPFGSVRSTRQCLFELFSPAPPINLITPLLPSRPSPSICSQSGTPTTITQCKVRRVRERERERERERGRERKRERPRTREGGTSQFYAPFYLYSLHAPERPDKGRSQQISSVMLELATRKKILVAPAL